MNVTTRVHLDTGDVRLEHHVTTDDDRNLLAIVGVGGIITPQVEIFARDAIALDRIAAECTRAADGLRAAEARAAERRAIATTNQIANAQKLLDEEQPA